jgi:hypothetical protein
MRVNHRRAYILMTKEFLHGANIITVLEQMSGKTVSKCMAARPLTYAGFSNGGAPRYHHHQLHRYKKGGHWNIDGSSIQRERPIVTGDSRLTNRWSQPLAGVMTTFGFIKQFSDFVTLAAASGGSAQTR